MSRCRSLGVMIDTRLGIYVQTHKHTAGPPLDTVVKILSPVSHFQSSGVDKHPLAMATSLHDNQHVCVYLSGHIDPSIRYSFRRSRQPLFMATLDIYLRPQKNHAIKSEENHNNVKIQGKGDYNQYRKTEVRNHCELTSTLSILSAI
ncbi:unnamed protein product [Hymenolepis diminuta]|uniref:Uncharacterized protein n=1 Tax=Hymenolepis diminuta TaxID=6216 RepID=A0A564Y862_HYMDI|nr:unnamed protein product [Hymenolepis diminuta]VUZ42714.1 unnamed protein product [Hymenolepis diminuta]VUZ42720.1 unnamed protein product [Hymenolepis diminuta]